MKEVILVLASFSASLVEMVEALTIVLAVGITKGWKTAMAATATALGILAAIIILFGPLISKMPLPLLRVIVGTLLLVFGLQWLRKAILRASGWKALHDEEQIFQDEVAALGGIAAGSRIDGAGFAVAFKGVLLEGLEVAFIVVTFGATQHRVGLAALGAASAAVLVVLIGFVVHRPLSKIPENALKMVVGVLLTSFGMFWAAEGLNARWPGGDVALLGIIVWIGLTTGALIVLLRTKRVAVTT
jgi:uncharacterized membrane protein